MTISHACILLACLLPIACAGIAKSRGFGKPRREGGYDNHNPRAWLEQLQGFQARANAAQYNSFEALPVFIAGVLIAEHSGAAQATVDALAVAFILCRLATSPSCGRPCGCWDWPAAWPCSSWAPDRGTSVPPSMGPESGQTGGLPC